MNDFRQYSPRPGLKAKTIKGVLRRKVDKWLESITDENLRKQCRKEAIVTGGSIASMLLGEKVNDFDIYFKSKQTVAAVADYYVKVFHAQRQKQGGVPVPIYPEEVTDTQGKARIRLVVKSAGVAGEGQTSDYNYFESESVNYDAGEYVAEAFDPLSSVKDIADEAREELEGDGEDYAPVFLSSNAISLRGKVQLILRFYGEPDEIHQSYDFAHCMNFWESDTGKLTLRPESLEALLSRTLVYSGSRYPICSLIRTRKFIERGWRINAGQYLKMAMQVSELDLGNHVVLEEQLTGVDVAYFTEVISKLKQKNPDAVDATYLIEIIDRMF